MTIINQRWSLNNYRQGRDCSSASSCIQLPFKADQAVLCFNSSTSRRRMGGHLQGSSLIGVGAPRKSCLLVRASCFWSVNSISSHRFDWWPSKGQETRRGDVTSPPLRHEGRARLGERCAVTQVGLISPSQRFNKSSLPCLGSGFIWERHS